MDQVDSMNSIKDKLSLGLSQDNMLLSTIGEHSKNIDTEITEHSDAVEEKYDMISMFLEKIEKNTKDMLMMDDSNEDTDNTYPTAASLASMKDSESAGALYLGDKLDSLIAVQDSGSDEDLLNALSAWIRRRV